MLSAHISQAGRGRIEQEALFLQGRSRAHWGESAHNYNMAIDVFRLMPGGGLYDVPWFREVIYPYVLNSNSSEDVQILWYGRRGAPYFELPHFEIEGWKMLGLARVE